MDPFHLLAPASRHSSKIGKPMIGLFLRLAFLLPLSVCGLPSLSFGSLIQTILPHSPCLGAAHCTISTRPLPLSVVQRPRAPLSCAEVVPIDRSMASAPA